MTYSKEVTLWCDSDDCEEWRQFSIPTITRALIRARNEGWSSPEWGTHYCPECSLDTGE